MSALNRLLGMASKALGDKDSSPSASRSGGSTDWRDVVRQAADKLTGDERPHATPAPQQQHRAHPAPHPPRPTGPHGGAENLSPEDRKAIARYDYLVQTAEPQELERIHREAFERLTPEQRAEVESRMREELPEGERPRSGGSDDLARAATRSEVMRPGSIRGLLSRAGGGRGRGMGAAGGLAAGAGIGLAGGLLATVAGGAVLSGVAAPLLEQAAGLGIDFDALAGTLDLGSITGLEEMTAGLGDQVSGLGDQVGGLGEQVSGLGEQASNFDLGTIGDLFNR